MYILRRTVYTRLYCRGAPLTWLSALRPEAAGEGGGLGTGTGHEGDVEALDLLHLRVVALGKDDVLSDADRVVAPPIE